MIYLKIDKRVKELNDTCAYIYMLLVYSKLIKKEISRKYLATCLGVKSEESDYISQCLKRIEKAGLIKRHNKFTNSHLKGVIKQIIDFDIIYKTYYMLSINILKIKDCPSKLIGFVLKLRELCFDDTLRVRTDFNKTDIANYFGITTQTLKKKLDLLKALEIIKEEDVVICSEEYFPRREDLQNRLSPENTENIRKILSGDPTTRLYKEFTWFCKNYIYLRKDANEIYNNILAGTLKKKNKPEIDFFI